MRCSTLRTAASHQCSCDTPTDAFQGCGLYHAVLHACARVACGTCVACMPLAPCVLHACMRATETCCMHACPLCPMRVACMHACVPLRHPACTRAPCSPCVFHACMHSTLSALCVLHACNNHVCWTHACMQPYVPTAHRAGGAASLACEQGGERNPSACRVAGGSANLVFFTCTPDPGCRFQDCILSLSSANRRAFCWGLFRHVLLVPRRLGNDSLGRLPLFGFQRGSQRQQTCCGRRPLPLHYLRTSGDACTSPCPHLMP